MEEIKSIVEDGVKEEITLTPKAISEVKKIILENEIPDNFGLRVGVKGGGCSGLSYTLGFDGEQRDGDSILDMDGVKIFVDWKSILYLRGTTIDYSDGLTGKGFVFNNPSAKRTCGCGSSFGV
jgi:iron-sulfur cluster assembly protein